jgi:hypothetical protein
VRQRLRLFLLLGILVALVTGISLDRWTRRQLDRELARMEERYGSLRGPTLVAPPVGVEYNSARFVRAASALTVRPGGATYGRLLASVKSFEKQPPSSTVPPDLQAFVDANTEAMRLAGEAIERHQASWDADYAGGGDVPRLLDIRTLSDAIALAALLDRNAGRDDEASRKTAAGFAVAASLRHEPSLISQLIRIAIVTRQCEAAGGLIAGSEPSKTALETLARTLADNRETDPLRVGLLAELRYGHGELVAMERQLLGRIGRPFLRLARIHYLREMERLIEIQAGPRPYPPFPGRPHYGRLNWKRFAARFVGGLERAIVSGDKHNSVLRVTEIGVALRRHRLDRGTYPDELSALVPAYLPRLPIDPVTGRPPVYARSGAGFTLKAETVSTESRTNAPLEWVVVR